LPVSRIRANPLGTADRRRKCGDRHQTGRLDGLRGYAAGPNDVRRRRVRPDVSRHCCGVGAGPPGEQNGSRRVETDLKRLPPPRSGLPSAESARPSPGIAHGGRDHARCAGTRERILLRWGVRGTTGRAAGPPLRDRGCCSWPLKNERPTWPVPPSINPGADRSTDHSTACWD